MENYNEGHKSDEPEEGGPSLGFTRGPKKCSFWIDVKVTLNPITAA
jgi:hypothetical protein